jgi:hypothetical protein
LSNEREGKGNVADGCISKNDESSGSRSRNGRLLDAVVGSVSVDAGRGALAGRGEERRVTLVHVLARSLVGREREARLAGALEAADRV